jgi:predicted NAD/FAD-dependent oxidoreductase
VVLFDKSKGYGGRMASRRRDGYAFDHGLPAFDPVGVETVDALADLPEWGSHGRVAVPRMNAFARAMGERFVSRMDTTIAAIEADGTAVIDTGGARHDGFTQVVVAIPGPQAAALLAIHGAPFADVAQASYHPGCTLLLGGTRGAAPDGERFVVESGPLAEVIRDDLKPGHPSALPCWVAHARTAWARANLERSKDDIAIDLATAFAEAMGIDPAGAGYVAAHRWRYSQVAMVAPAPFLLSENGRIGACGDWCGEDRRGGDARSAWRSGEALGRAIAVA